jgi:aminoglycoside N3'-acetyltransferase
MWSLMSGLDLPREAIAPIILEVLFDVAGPDRTILMPVFTSGYRDGFLDLDVAPTNMGLLNEAFRNYQGVSRTVSAFFSFAVLGPDTKEVIALRPKNAWGEGSLYEWFELSDAQCLLLGVSRTTFSYLHRLEWLVKETIPYRYSKDFSGKVRHQGAEFNLHESLFVRDLSNGVDNSWVDYNDLLSSRGMPGFNVGHGLVSTMSTLEFRRNLLPFIERDPFAFVKDREKYRALYNSNLS